MLQIWNADLRDWNSWAVQLAGLLSNGETARLERLKIQAKRTEFLISRGLLRLVLGSYLEGHPRELEIRTSPQGKPFLPGRSLHFNVSHSGTRLLVACGRFEHIGVDIQEIYQISSRETVAKRFFSPAEQDYLADQEFHPDSFFELWTAKEAYLKALGGGFQDLPSASSLLPDPSYPGRFTLTEPDRDPERWTVITLAVGDGYKGAVAVDGEFVELHSIPLAPLNPQAGKTLPG